MIKRIVIHATNTPSDTALTLDDIMDLNSGNRHADPMPYHYIINVGGEMLKGRKDRELCGHCGRFSKESLSVAYVGGIDPISEDMGEEELQDIVPHNTLNAEQEKSLRFLIGQLQERFEGVEVTGANALLHPDEALSENEPYFDVSKWMGVGETEHAPSLQISVD